MIYYRRVVDGKRIRASMNTDDWEEAAGWRYEFEEKAGVSSAALEVLRYSLFSSGNFALVFYLVTYYVATLGAFGCAMVLANRFGAEDTDDYRGLGWSSPWICAAFVVFLVSLTGLPPTIGFAGKWLLFRATMDTGLYWLAVVAALNAVVALFYYFKIARALFLRGDTEPVPGLAWRGVMPWFAKAAIIALAIAALWYGIMLDGLIGWVDSTLL